MKHDAIFELLNKQNRGKLMKKTLLLTIVLGMSFSACSTMGFMPPDFSLATESFVNEQIDSQVRTALSEVDEKTFRLSEDLKKMEADLEQMKNDVQAQKDAMSQALVSVQQINDLATQIKVIAKTSKDEVQTVRQDLMDSLDELADRLDQELETLNTAVTKLEAQSGVLEQNIQKVPKETLFELRQAIDAYYQK